MRAVGLRRPWYDQQEADHTKACGGLSMIRLRLPGSRARDRDVRRSQCGQWACGGLGMIRLLLFLLALSACDGPGSDDALPGADTLGPSCPEDTEAFRTLLWEPVLASPCAT